MAGRPWPIATCPPECCNTCAPWPPDLGVSLGSAILRTGSAITFSNTAAGSVDARTLTLRNPGLGAADLHITGVTLTGAQAGEFKILTPPQSPVPAGGETFM